MLRSADLGSTITKLAGYYALTENGDVYTTNTTTAQLIDQNVIDICITGYIKSDGYYNYNKTKLVSGTFTNIISSDAISNVPNAVLFSGSGNIQKRTVYTVPNPLANYKSFVGLDLSGHDTITAVVANTIITNSTHSFTRDIGNDNYFTQTPDDLKKQTPTKWDLIDMVNNLE